MPIPIKHFQTIEPRHWVPLGRLSFGVGRHIITDMFDKLKPQADWCEENCSGFIECGWFELADTYEVGFMFVDEADAMAFKLAWV